MDKTKDIYPQLISGNMFTSFIRCLRPRQWTKNLLVFAALLFSITKIVPSQAMDAVVGAVVGFILFCMTSGVVYIINDYADAEQDRLHPEKRFRPIASGAIRPNTALAMGTILLVISFIIAFYVNWIFALLLTGYFIMNIAYSFWLKHIVIIDVMIIAAGFVIRAIGGAIVIDVPFTPWFLVCTMLLALFLAISKRRHEFMLLQDHKGSHRKVLDYYSAQLLDQFISIVTTATIMSYALYTFNSGNNVNLMWTLPLVIYGIFRYLYLIYMENKGGSPEKLLLQDKHILVTVVLYAVTVCVILIYGGSK